MSIPKSKEQDVHSEEFSFQSEKGDLRLEIASLQ